MFFPCTQRKVLNNLATDFCRPVSGIFDIFNYLVEKEEIKSNLFILIIYHFLIYNGTLRTNNGNVFHGIKFQIIS